MLVKRIALIVIPAAGLVFSGCQVAPKTEVRGPSLGYLEHRGRAHDLRALMDPHYRAASDDAFARGFEPQTHLAADVNDR